MKSMRIAILALVGLTNTVVLSTASAEQPAAQAQSGAVSASMTDGEVRKINKDAGKITIKHGPILNLDMPGMTMVFRAKDPAMLDQVKAGDKIKFQAENVNGALTVTRFEPAQ